MGTSRNDPSPRVPVWLPALAMLAREAVPQERQAVEVWRAAAADRSGRLAVELGDPLVARACEVASRSTGVAESLQAFDADVARSRSAGLYLDITRRALARTAARGGGASEFASELFAEAGNYFVARDLPSFVGASGRLSTVAAARGLASEISRITQERVVSVGAPDHSTDQGWRSYVDAALDVLTRRPSE